MTNVFKFKQDDRIIFQDGRHGRVVNPIEHDLYDYTVIFDDNEIYQVRESELRYE